MTIPTITEYTGVVPDRRTQSAEEFTSAAVTWTDYQASVLAPDINATTIALNVATVGIDDSVGLAEEASFVAQAAANYQGAWFSGASVNKGETWNYNGIMWAANIDGAGIPQEGADWVSINSAGSIITDQGASAQDIFNSLELEIYQTPTDNLVNISCLSTGINTVYEIRRVSDDSLAVIYSDKDGSSQIIQNGTDNKSDSNALVSFYVADGEYYITSESSTKLFNAGLPSEITQGANNGGCYIILDDAGTVAKDSIIPALDGLGFKFGLAPYLFGIKASYDVITMGEMLELKKEYGSEILSHGSYHVAYDSDMPLAVGENYINAAAKQFNQYGFEVNGFVAPNSQLDSKFKPSVINNHDYAFVRSFGVNSATFVCNRATDDMYDLARVSLEAITLAQAKVYVDYAAENSLYLCFYTHAAVSYLEDLVEYMQLSGLPNINPSEWVASIKGLKKGWYPTSSGNMIENSAFDRINTTSDTIADGDENPSGWTFDLSEISGSTAKILRGTPTRLDISGIASAGAEQMLFSQQVEVGAIRDFTPMCFSARVTGAGDNSAIRISMRLKTAGNAVIKEFTKIEDVAVGEQLVYIAEGFIADATASYIEVELVVVSKAAGQSRCLISDIQLEKSGKPTAFIPSGYSETYFNQLRITQGATIQPNTDTLVVFDDNATGENKIFDLATGKAEPLNRKNYRLNVNLGLQLMDAGDVMELFLIVNGSPSRRAQFVCSSGDNIKNTSWDISANGTEYAVGIRHNSISPRAITTFSNALLTVSGES